MRFVIMFYATCVVAVSQACCPALQSEVSCSIPFSGCGIWACFERVAYPLKMDPREQSATAEAAYPGF